MIVSDTKTLRLLYGKTGCEVRVPASATVLEGQDVPPVPQPRERIKAALENPIGSGPLRELIARRKPRTVAITISDITRPVPNKVFLPPLLETLNACGVADSQIVIIIGTGMHRPSTPQERDILLGQDILARVEVIDHAAEQPDTLVQVTDGSDGQPRVSVNKRFAQADFRIVTGYIEPHFMAGFSGGRKGVCPALVDLGTLQRFHGYRTLSHPAADTGVLKDNPCHQESLRVAQAVGVDFLFNVAITRDRQIAGIYCGDLVKAHQAGCEEVARWTAATIDEPFDLVITNGGGFPLDQTFYQTVKGMVTALPALKSGAILLQISHCGQQLGSDAYTDLMLRWDNDWRGFLSCIAATDQTDLDQWEFQMQCKVLDRIGVAGLRLVTDGVPADIQEHIAVTPILGPGDAPTRFQQAIDQYVAGHPAARIAVIPDGPYTMLQSR